MANDSKYDRLYPERAVAKARAVLETVHTRDAQIALTDLDRLGFPPDEPLFLLRGQDELAPETVEFYFQRVRGSGLAVDDEHVSEHIDAMLAWRPRKMPD